jgi:UDP:flavonoid glycosyltransferase YjiC (YdhE family)
MRILATTSPLMGHLRPMLPLLRAATDAGHEVVVATGPDLVREVQRRGYQTGSAGPVAADILAARSAGSLSGDPAARIHRSASTMFGSRVSPGPAPCCPGPADGRPTWCCTRSPRSPALRSPR